MVQNMEKVFKARWWDYSDKKFNINVTQVHKCEKVKKC